MAGRSFPAAGAPGSLLASVQFFYSWAGTQRGSASRKGGPRTNVGPVPAPGRVAGGTTPTPSLVPPRRAEHHNRDIGAAGGPAPPPSRHGQKRLYAGAPPGRGRAAGWART